MVVNLLLLLTGLFIVIRKSQIDKDILCSVVSGGGWFG